MTEAMPFLQKTILLSYDPRSFRAGLMFEFIPHQKGSLSGAFKLILLCFPAECGYP